MRLLALFVCFGAVPALAAGGAGDLTAAPAPLELWGSDNSHSLPVGLLLINFLLLFGGIGFYLRKKIVRMLDDRASRFESLVNAAREAEAMAKERQAELEARLAGLQGELDGLRAEFSSRLVAEEEAVRSRTAREIARMESSAKAQLAQESALAHAQLREEAASIALRLAREQVGQAVSAQDHDRMTQGFVRDLEALS